MYAGKVGDRAMVSGFDPRDEDILTEGVVTRVEYRPTLRGDKLAFYTVRVPDGRETTEPAYFVMEA